MSLDLGFRPVRAALLYRRLENRADVGPVAESLDGFHLAAVASSLGALGLDRGPELRLGVAELRLQLGDRRLVVCGQVRLLREGEQLRANLRRPNGEFLCLSQRDFLRLIDRFQCDLATSYLTPHSTLLKYRLEAKSVVSTKFSTSWPHFFSAAVNGLEFSRAVLRMWQSRQRVCRLDVCSRPP